MILVSELKDSLFLQNTESLSLGIKKQTFQLTEKVYIIYNNIIWYLQDDGRKIQNTFNTKGNQFITNLLSCYFGNGDDCSLYIMLFYNFFHFILRINRYAVSLGVFGRSKVEPCNDDDSVSPESLVISKCLTDIPHPDYYHLSVTAAFENT